MPPNLKPWNPRNLKAPHSCCCTGCANKPGSCIRGWYLSRQLSKETYGLWKLPRVDSQNCDPKSKSCWCNCCKKDGCCICGCAVPALGQIFKKKIGWFLGDAMISFQSTKACPKIMERTWGFQVGHGYQFGGTECVVMNFATVEDISMRQFPISRKKNNAKGHGSSLYL